MTLEEMKLLRPKRNIRDSVFKFIVKRERYLREVYLSLYPDDTGIRNDEIRLLTSENVFIGSVIHDCCFLVRNERLVFIEVQSTPCRLLPERMERYYAQMIPRLSPDWDGRQYSVCGLDLPFPEFWVIYVGENAERQPEFCCLGGKDECKKGRLYVPVRVITRYNEAGFVTEYCLFSQIYLENLLRYKDTAETVRKALEECTEKGILRDFLEDNKREVMEIMGKSNEYYFNKYVEAMNKMSETKGRSEGRSEGISETVKRFDSAFREEGISREQAERIIRRVSQSE